MSTSVAGTYWVAEKGEFGERVAGRVFLGKSPTVAMLFNIEDLAELQASVATPDNGTISTLYITRSVSNGFATDYEVAYKKGVGSLLEVPAPALSDLSSTLAAFAAALATLETADWDDSRPPGISESQLPPYLHQDGLTATFVAFRNHDGTPVTPPQVVVITLTVDGTDIDDIRVYDSIDEVGA
jgi:hypothetical protein